MRSVVFTGDRPQSPWAAANLRPAVAPAPTAVYGTPNPLPEPDAGIDGIRKLVLGQHLSDVQTKVAELQLSLNGEAGRIRAALMQRVDELAGHLHRDMVMLREEMRQEIGLLKADLFAAATSLSAVKDHIGQIEANVRHETHAAIADFDGRLSRQEFAFSSVLENAEAKLRSTIESRCAEAFSQLVRKSDISRHLAQVGDRLMREPGAADSPAATAPSRPVPAPEEDSAIVLTGGLPRSASDWVGASHNPFLLAADQTV